VLTEPKWFLGSDRYLREIAETVSVPVLRKDFTVDPYMIYEAKVLGAGAVLLICSLLTAEEIEVYIRIADSLGMSALVEAHDEEELSKAVAAGARVIGVNNRNLKDFTVDIHNSIRLRKLAPADTLFVAESGIRTAADIAELKENGVNGVLIGETLMRASDKRRALAELGGEQYG
jgi:indole-3-glycerol phosphate synthase